MWRSLSNFFSSLWTYPDLSPDLGVRRRVNRMLRKRPSLSCADWHTSFWHTQKISRQVSEFVYGHLQNYSGLEWGRVHPRDRLLEDLHLHLVCWFDWQTTFCQDFLCYFGTDLSDCFDPDQLATVEELMIFLNQQALLGKRIKN